MIRRRATVAAALSALALLPLLTSCADTPGPDTSLTSSHDAQSAAVTIDSAWAKAGTGMTGVFGTLHNHTDTDLTITDLTSESAQMVELHEVTADGVMQAIDTPVVIPAQSTLELAPGGTHIMLMQMPHELLAGDTITVTLGLSNGATAPLEMLVKEYSGANESYDDLAHTEHHDHAGH